MTEPWRADREPPDGASLAELVEWMRVWVDTHAGQKVYWMGAPNRCVYKIMALAEKYRDGLCSIGGIDAKDLPAFGPPMDEVKAARFLTLVREAKDKQP